MTTSFTFKDLTAILMRFLEKPAIIDNLFDPINPKS